MRLKDTHAKDKRLISHKVQQTHFIILIMNPVHLTLEEKSKIAEMSDRLPKGKGLKFLRWAEPSLDKIVKKTDNKNTVNVVRSKQLDPDTIITFVKRIKEGRYLYSYDQPIYIEIPNTDSYLLICGEHRYQAHQGSGLDKMFGAVVKFDTEYDQLVFQSNENQEENEYVKNPRTSEDLILTLTQMVKMGAIDIDNDKSINRALGDLNQKDNDYPVLREKLRNKFGKVNPVKSWEDDDKKKWIKNNYPEIKLSTRKRVILVDNVVYTTRTFKGGQGKNGVSDLDYDPRCFFDTCEILLKNPDCNVTHIAHYNKANSEKIEKLRNYKQNKMFKEWQKKVLEIADAIRSGEINPVKQTNFVHMPQLNDIDSSQEFVK